MVGINYENQYYSYQNLGGSSLADVNQFKKEVKKYSIRRWKKEICVKFLLLQEKEIYKEDQKDNWYYFYLCHANVEAKCWEIDYMFNIIEKKNVSKNFAKELEVSIDIDIELQKYKEKKI